jgi:hypothetical protein
VVDADCFNTRVKQNRMFANETSGFGGAEELFFRVKSCD